MKFFFRVSTYYSFANKLINLFVVRRIKINLVRNLPGLSLFVLEQSKVRQTLSSLYANSIKSPLIQRDGCGIYLLVFRIQAPSKIFLSLLSGTVAEKMLVCDKIVRQIAFSG